MTFRVTLKRGQLVVCCVFFLCVCLSFPLTPQTPPPLFFFFLGGRVGIGGGHGRILSRFYIYSCQVIVIIGDSVLCCCVRCHACYVSREPLRPLVLDSPFAIDCFSLNFRKGLIKCRKIDRENCTVYFILFYSFFLFSFFCYFHISFPDVSA